MSTVKVVLRKKPNKDGTLPLALRVTKNRQTSFIHLGYSLRETEWDATAQRVRKSHPNSARLNNFIVKKLAESTDSALELETAKPDTSARSVKHKIKPSSATGITFFAQADAFLESRKLAGKYNQYKPDGTRLKNFLEFLHGKPILTDETQQQHVTNRHAQRKYTKTLCELIKLNKANDIAFADITPALLERFRGFLRGKMQLGERTAVNHLVVIRSVFSYAIKEQIIDPKYYPFGKGKVKIKIPESIKIGLTLNEVQQLEQAELTEPSHNHARNLWLISFYFAGMRVSDVLRLKWSDIHDNRLHYAMGKNNKIGSLKIPDKAAEIFDAYRKMERNKNDVIFPDLAETNLENKYMTQRRIAFRVSAIDKTLRRYVAPAAGIDKKLTMHIARHTFGNISGDKISIQMLQRLYRHSNITTTIGYQQNFIHQDMDDALTAVIGC